MPKVISINMILNMYQIQVYNHENDLIHTSIYEGFDEVEAIKNCRDNMNLNIPGATFPLKFHTKITK